MIHGPTRYTPIVTVELIEKRVSIAMDKNEGSNFYISFLSLFKQTNLYQSNFFLVEPEDPKTYESLKKSVTLAIEITTSMQEAEAQRAAQKQEQEALEVLKKQKIEDEVAAESDKKKYNNILIFTSCYFIE